MHISNVIYIYVTQIETMSDYEEYTEYVHGLFISGTLRLAHALIGEDMDEDSLTFLSHSMACLHQVTVCVYMRLCF